MYYCHDYYILAIFVEFTIYHIYCYYYEFLWAVVTEWEIVELMNAGDFETHMYNCIKFVNPIKFCISTAVNVLLTNLILWYQLEFPDVRCSHNSLHYLYMFYLEIPVSSPNSGLFSHAWLLY